MQNLSKMCCSTSSARARADDLVEARPRGLQIGEQELLRRRRLRTRARRACRDASRALRAVTHAARSRSPRDFAQRLLAGERARPSRTASASSPSPCRRGHATDRLVACHCRAASRTCWRRSSRRGDAVSSSSRWSSSVSGSLPIENDHDDRSATLARLHRRATRLRVRRRLRVAHAGGVDERTAMPSISTRSVTRSRVVPGTLGHDRALVPEQSVEQARLADVWPAGEHDRRAFANHASARGIAEQAHRAARSPRVDAPGVSAGSMKW